SLRQILPHARETGGPTAVSRWSMGSPLGNKFQAPPFMKPNFRSPRGLSPVSSEAAQTCSGIVDGVGLICSALFAGCGRAELQASPRGTVGFYQRFQRLPQQVEFSPYDQR